MVVPPVYAVVYVHGSTQSEEPPCWKSISPSAWANAVVQLIIVVNKVVITFFFMAKTLEFIFFRITKIDKQIFSYYEKTGNA